ncbi:hypothetical protein [Cohnella abietis]|uniref:Uncharacterized protein n=1 Tax=Cohnella abietis TaxID=2507935 RepID=A0A3T1DAL7_9BACL|nr:hypothetical protein [Cohnella abietis]BBI35018.1 hypothetical protein KCTCHS21_44170 [Cohnella abietis]
MNRWQREWEIKLQLMGAISRSQEALAKILESVADVTEVAGVSVSTLHEHVRVLTGLQGALLRRATGTSWNPPVRGKPASPWLADTIRSSNRNVGGASD